MELQRYRSGVTKGLNRLGGLISEHKTLIIVIMKQYKISSSVAVQLATECSSVAQLIGFMNTHIEEFLKNHRAELEATKLYRGEGWEIDKIFNNLSLAQTHTSSLHTHPSCLAWVTHRVNDALIESLHTSPEMRQEFKKDYKVPGWTGLVHIRQRTELTQDRGQEALSVATLKKIFENFPLEIKNIILTPIGAVYDVALYAPDLPRMCWTELIGDYQKNIPITFSRLLSTLTIAPQFVEVEDKIFKQICSQFSKKEQIAVLEKELLDLEIQGCQSRMGHYKI